MSGWTHSSKDLSRDDLISMSLLFKHHVVLIAPLAFSSVILVANAAKLVPGKQVTAILLPPISTRGVCRSVTSRQSVPG
jgi:hypothetical protein